MMMFALLLLAGFGTAGASAPPMAGNWTAHRLPDATKAPQNARCLE